MARDMTAVFDAFHRDLMALYLRPVQPSFNHAYRQAVCLAQTAGRDYPSRESARAHARKALLAKKERV